MDEKSFAAEPDGAATPVTDAHPQRWRLLALLGVAQLMLIVDVTVVAIALPRMGADLELSRSALTWVVSAYTLAFGGLLLLGGRLADLWGSRVVVLTGLTIFTTASLVTGLSGNAEVLIGGRVGQGLGAALMSPAALSLVVKLFDGEERNKALGIWSSLGGTGAALGVLLGGVLTAGPGWSWVFYVNVPIGVVILLVLGQTLESDRPRAATARLDVVGALLVTLGTGSAAYGLINAGERGWWSGATLLPVGAAVVLYIVLAVHQRTVDAPLIDPALLGRRSVATGTFLIMVATAVMISLFFIGTFSLQHLRGFGALATGLLFLPVAAGSIAGANAAGRLIGSQGPRRVSAVGMLLAAAGSGVPLLMDGSAMLVVGMSLAAVGLGAVFVGASVTTLSHVGHHEAGIASGVLSTFHELGAALGVAATSSLAAASISGASDDGIARALAGVVAVSLVAAALVSIVMRRPEV
ncbi:MFS transporter [Nocardioides seonyuensis]|uniref:MFS transporter n=1 Tax=Nocardioides seonyuensis TaxID=2518371 RepID=A0A4P7IJ18_9ACTN|nr:MFS transporter [Nocardioides seonyuensis]QBX56753.1 MFS transporter [Nocardioides seonyuensis]